MRDDGLEVWGGIECTINRVDDKFYDQLDINGGYARGLDLELICSTGIKTLRYPLLWEKYQPTAESIPDFRIAEVHLKYLSENDVTIIAGLLHHGCGPAFTSLIDENFPELFAAYAAKVAEYFPWIKYYNPVNEPLTTARFSGLYGHWYPHKKNDVIFLKIFLNELKAVVLAMQEIRKINPEAVLIQTEDLGKTYSTSLLKYQADFENERRWLTWDILSGKFNSTSPLWGYFMRLGISENQLNFFIDNPCIPGIMGVNYYITSERYIDEETIKYHANTHGGNGIHDYADTEAARVNIHGNGLKHLLKEVWERYKISIAITEAHLNCHREQQVEWLREIFSTCSDLNKEGIHLKAVTCWALSGSSGWNRLLTTEPFQYEPGALDSSCGYARQTALFRFIKNTIQNSNAVNKIHNGWWNTDKRSLKNIVTTPILITGRNGTLGTAMSEACRSRGIPFIALCREEGDLCNADQFKEIINKYKPGVIINTAGYVKVDEAEDNPELCYRENSEGVANINALCKEYNIKLITFSSDLVFNGKSDKPYVESNTTDPINTYGLSKLLAEHYLRENLNSLIIRTSYFFSPHDEFNFIRTAIKEIAQGKDVILPDDIYISPTYVPNLADAVLDLLEDEENGIIHLVNKGIMSWHQCVKIVADMIGVDSSLLQPANNLSFRAMRPNMSALTSERYGLMPSIENAFNEYVNHPECNIREFRNYNRRKLSETI